MNGSAVHPPEVTPVTPRNISSGNTLEKKLLIVVITHEISKIVCETYIP